jgi:transcriptional regulator with XRE-family HTH domain
MSIPFVIFIAKNITVCYNAFGGMLMLNENIARLRKNRGLTQVEFSKQLHVTQSAVSHWESGRSVPDTVQLFRIAEFFGVSVEALSNTKHESPTQSEPPAPVPAQEKAPADERTEARKLLEAMDDETYQAALQYLKFLKAQKG